MQRKSVSASLALSGFDDLFQSTIPTPEMQTDSGRIIHLPLGELHPPEFHPFQIREDAAMQRLVRSVERYGVREPGLARPRSEGGYELVAGNRRKRASEIAGKPTLPVIVKDMDDDEAAIAMVDSNLEQRELLFSEKAWAYRVKLEALNHRGVKSETPGELSVDILCEQTGEKKNTIYRLIRLTELIPSLLDKVDAGTLKFNPAVALSYLTRTEQAMVADYLAQSEMRPSLSKANKLREAAKNETLSVCMIETILTETKKGEEKAAPPYERFVRYFPESYTEQQMETVIDGLLQSWHKNQQTAS